MVASEMALVCLLSLVATLLSREGSLLFPFFLAQSAFSSAFCSILSTLWQQEGYFQSLFGSESHLLPGTKLRTSPIVQRFDTASAVAV